MRVVIGRVGRAHGIRGDLAVEIRTDEPERRFTAGATVWLGDREHTIASSRPHQGRLLVSFSGVGDRTAAERLRGTIIEVDVDPDETPSEPEEFYDRQLIGLIVLAADGQRAGSVRDVLHLPAHDLLAVATTSGREVLVPFVQALVPHVDLAAGTLTVADVPGLLDPDRAVEATGAVGAGIDDGNA